MERYAGTSQKLRTRRMLVLRRHPGGLNARRRLTWRQASARRSSPAGAAEEAVPLIAGYADAWQRLGELGTNVRRVSRRKTTVRWTVVPANARATEGSGRCPSEAGSAKRRDRPSERLHRDVHAGPWHGAGRRSAKANHRHRHLVGRFYQTASLNICTGSLLPRISTSPICSNG